jgi:ubiquinone/menaquinone biosynthesis C-methylase UbiE
MGTISGQHYSMGIIGYSLLRHWYREGDVNELRLEEIRALLEAADQFPWNLALDPTEQDLRSGYAEWSEFYDGPNPLIDAEERVTRPLLERLAGVGTRALDAACGTGRQAAFLDALGGSVYGVDQSLEMLALALVKLPHVEFERADLEQLPFEDDRFDLAVVSLALCHLADPGPALAELARVVRPGGAVVVTDPHPAIGSAGGQAFYGGRFVEERSMRWVRNHYHLASRWLAAFRAAGLAVEECIEEPYSDEQIAAFPSALFHRDATIAAFSGLPCLWVWQLRVLP